MFQKVKSDLKSINYTGLFFELVIVFIGVYLAFILANYQAERQFEKERTRVIAILKVGVERYQKAFADFAAYHENYNKEFRKQMDDGFIPYFGDVYYPAPQYPIDMINYLLTKESFKVFELEIYLPLTEYATNIKRIMYVEEKLVELSHEYQQLQSPISKNDPVLVAEMKHKAQRFLSYLEIRKNTANRLVGISNRLAEIL